MKNTLTLTLGLVALAAMSANTASAEPALNFKPYIGVDFQHTAVQYNDNYDIGGGLFLDGDAILEDGLNGVNIHVGNRFNENFGVELGYFRTRSEGKSINAGDAIGPGTIAAVGFKTDMQLQGVTFDALGYLPVGAANGLELIGTAGVAWTKAEATLMGISDDDSELGFRVGGGAQ